MRRTAIRIAVLGGLLVLVAFVVVVANQTAQLVALGSQIAPWLGAAILWFLLALYSICILAPIYLLARLPKALKPPATEDDPAFPVHLAQLQKRLKRNPLSASIPHGTREEIAECLRTLDAVAEERIRRAASQVFVTTAVSQNGSLDMLLVLSAQSKLILEVARIYYQRPTVREMLSLYANVAGTALVAGELEDIDIAEQLEPITAALFGSAVGAVPGLGAATTVLTNSLLSGIANAYLTLRVGIIAEQYCRALILPPRRSIRRLAATRAAGMLGGIALSGSKRVMGAVAETGKAKLGSAISAAGDSLRAVGTGVRDAGVAAVSATGDRLRGAASTASGAAAAAGSGLVELGATVADKLHIVQRSPNAPAAKP